MRARRLSSTGDQKPATCICSSSKRLRKGKVAGRESEDVGARKMVREGGGGREGRVRREKGPTILLSLRTQTEQAGGGHATERKFLDHFMRKEGMQGGREERRGEGVGGERVGWRRRATRTRLATARPSEAWSAIYDALFNTQISITGQEIEMFGRLSSSVDEVKWG